MIEHYLASADSTVDCVYRQWFLQVFLGPFSPIYVKDRIMAMSDAVWSEGPEDHGDPTKVFVPVPYAQIFLQFL